ncbi:hypothetical protein GCM10019998_23250 [Tetragenococcus solitarius]|uniref:Uncharacterized protein n=1 Tax=Tetragenococcus solitarius TaxID=71453 RepID=A0ABN3YD78_9ENTE
MIAEITIIIDESRKYVKSVTRIFKKPSYFKFYFVLDILKISISDKNRYIEKDKVGEKRWIMNR